MREFYHLFNDTKYTKWYISIIENAKSENRKKLKRDNSDYFYYENHHIIPKCILPEFANLWRFKQNGVLLTVKEHIVCHLLLMKMMSSSFHAEKMKRAYMGMVISSNRRIVPLRYQLTARSLKVLGRIKSEEEIVKIKKALTGRKYTEEQREALRNRVFDDREGTNKKISEALTGRKLTDEHKANIKAGLRPVEEYGYKISAKLKIVAANRTPEQIKKTGDAKKGAIGINKNNKTKYVKAENLQEYISNGWALGVVKLGPRKMKNVG